MLRDTIAKYVPVMRRQSLSRQQALAVTPIRNQRLTWKEVGGGDVLLTIPRRADRLGRAIGFIFKIPNHKELLLDEVGGKVWELCDGKNDIGAIVAETSRRYKLNKREAEVSVTTYIKMLAERRLVGLVQRGGKRRNGRR